MEEFNYTVANLTGDQVARHYPFTTEGLEKAFKHATDFGYTVWQSQYGNPVYLLYYCGVK